MSFAPTRLALAFALLLLGCRPSAEVFDEARRLSIRGDWVEAARYYERALQIDPGNVEYRIAFHRARLEASFLLLSRARESLAAGDLESAASDYEAALELDPSNRYAREELSELRRDLEAPEPPDEIIVERERLPIAPPRWIDPDSPEPLQLRFSEGTSLKTVLESLARLAGVNILFDEAYRDTTVDVDLHGVTFWEALDLLTQTNGLFYKVIESSTVRISTEPVR